MISESAISESAIDEGSGTVETRGENAKFGTVYAVTHNSGRISIEPQHIGNISGQPARGGN